jgi:hypothetical protein
MLEKYCEPLVGWSRRKRTKRREEEEKEEEKKEEQEEEEKEEEEEIEGKAKHCTLRRNQPRYHMFCAPKTRHYVFVETKVLNDTSKCCSSTAFWLPISTAPC